MRSHDNDDHTARNLALVGGGALLVWLLVSGGGGLGLGGSGGTAAAAPAPAPPPAPPPPPPPPCKVRIDILGVHVNGKPADINTAVERCRAAKRAWLVVTGDARHGTYDELMRALAAAGISTASNRP